MRVKRTVFLAVFLVFLGESFSLSTSLWEHLAKRRLSSPPKKVVPVVPEKITVPERDYKAEFERTLKEVESYINREEKLTKGRIYSTELEELLFLPFKDHYLSWEKLGVHPRLFVVLGGKVEPEDLVKLSAAEKLSLDSLSPRVKKVLAQKKIDRVYLLKEPVFVGPSGFLKLQNVAFLLSVRTCPAILVNGRMLIAKSLVAAFDPDKRDFASRRPISYREADLYGVQEPRPYILALSGGTLIVHHSYIRGLGYRTLMGGFGIGGKNWLFFGIRRNPFLLFLKADTPTMAVLYKNRVEDCFMGFYGYNLRKGLIVRNHFVRNWKYGINIHDWSNVYIAGNVVEGTRLAHGIILSRYCSGTIYGNFSLKNRGAGIMLERFSMGRIARNLLWRNYSGGISLLESGGAGVAVIEHNLLLHNYPYGLFVRNSSGILVKKNRFVHNLGPGAKVITADISFQIYRNLGLDPYREVAWAWFESNIFNENLDSDLETLRGGAVGLENNRFSPQMLILGGEARKYNYLVLKKPYLVIKGYGNPVWHQVEPVSERVYRVSVSVISHLLKAQNPEARTAEGLMMSIPPSVVSDIPRRLVRGEVKPECARMWLLSAALRGDPNAMVLLGVLELKYSLAPHKTALRWIALGTLYGGRDGFFVLQWAPRWWGLPDGAGYHALEEVLRGVKCSGISLLPWPEALDGCVPYADWAERLRNRLRNLVEESGFCGEHASASTVWGYLERKSLREARRDLESYLEEIKNFIKNKNMGRIAYYRELDRMSEELKKALAESDPSIMRVVAKETEKEMWHRVWFEKNFAKDLGLICGFEKEIPIPRVKGLEMCTK
ncbi:MAG: right-handed parallel beta-helix repeat-containing protein [Deferribacteres bacterium]|nr:right-handed parallel beta-helix repeat-containing protein [Deferribacteres bacterium]